MSDKTDITQLLEAAGAGDSRAADKLMPLVYEELRRLASDLMQRERADHTFDPTGLVHEAYMRLVNQTKAQWRDRAHFVAVAAQAMRRILIDYARGHNRSKRGGDRAQVALTENLAGTCGGEVDLIELDEALKRLATEKLDYARLVELRFFAGLSVAETAAILGVSTATTERNWRYVRARLYQLLSDEDRGPASGAGHDK